MIGLLHSLCLKCSKFLGGFPWKSPGAFVFQNLARLEHLQIYPFQKCFPDIRKAGQERAMAAGVKFGCKPKLSKIEEESLASWIKEEVLSKEDLAEKFNVSVSTIYRRMSTVNKSAA